MLASTTSLVAREGHGKATANNETGQEDESEEEED